MTSSTPQAPETKAPQTMLSWTDGIAYALEARGIKSQVIFEKADIPYLTTPGRPDRIEGHKIATLFQLAVEATKDPCFGLKLVPYLHAANFSALGYSLFSSSTLHDFCLRLVRFFRLVSENALHHFQEEKDAFKLTVEITNPVVCYEVVDAWVATLVHFCRYIYRPDFSPKRIELIRPKPESNAEEFDIFFNSPVIFSAKEIAICFDKKDMLMPLPTASKELARRNDEIVIEHLARLDRDDIVRQVEAKIVELLPTGECSREEISSQLNMSSRSLLNKLEQKNTSYKEILEDLRSTLAQQYIEQKNMQITEITYVLGFSDTSSFSRAFRRWTGKSPSDFRTEKFPHTGQT